MFLASEIGYHVFVTDNIKSIFSSINIHFMAVNNLDILLRSVEIVNNAKYFPLKSGVWQLYSLIEIKARLKEKGLHFIEFTLL